VRSVASEKTYPKNAVVLTEGEMGDFALHDPERQGEGLHRRRGRPRDHPEDPRHRRLSSARCPMIDKQPRSASVTTSEPSTFLVLSHSAFEKCVEQAPRIANMVMQILAHRVREADRKIGTLALMDVYGRVASTLLELAVYSDGKADGGREAVAAGPGQNGGRLARDGEPHPQGPLGPRLHLDRIEGHHHHQPELPPSL